MNALIFDCDGVLADTERDGHRTAFNRVFHEQCIEFFWSVEDYGQAIAVAGGKERLRALMTPSFVQQHALPRDPDRLEELIWRWHQRKTQIFVELLESGEVAPRPGVRRLATEAADAGWRLAVASTSARTSVAAVLKLAVGVELASEFAILAGDDVARKKPAPDVYLEALRATDTASRCAIAVEDSHIGVRAARAAGMEVLATPSTYTNREDLTDAILVVRSLGEESGPPLAPAKNDLRLDIDRTIDIAHLERILADDRARAAQTEGTRRA